MLEFIFTVIIDTPGGWGGGRWDLLGSENRGQKGAEPPTPSPTSHPHIGASTVYIGFSEIFSEQIVSSRSCVVKFSSCGAFLWDTYDLPRGLPNRKKSPMTYAKETSWNLSRATRLLKCKWAFCLPSLLLSLYSNALPPLVLVSSS